MPHRDPPAEAEGEFEPGSNAQVLRNRAGITSASDMAELELQLLDALRDEVLVRNLPQRQLTVDDLRHWHRMWLGKVYAWAGQERPVDLGPGGATFGTSGLLPELLRVFERECLARWTPCSKLAPDALVNAIAVTHVELRVIRPFRRGNARLSRLLADVMAVQAGHAPLDHTRWTHHEPAYVAAIQAGFAGDHEPMAQFVAQAMAARP